jgi:hypothetical protein
VRVKVMHVAKFIALDDAQGRHVGYQVDDVAGADEVALLNPGPPKP